MPEDELPTQSSIFQVDDRPVKFFIQKDLDSDVVERLQNQITTHGGKVEDKVPLQGFLLLGIDTPEGHRLIECWDTPTRPKRHFVPHTFVDACLTAGKLISQVFRQNGVSLGILLHPCITDENLIASLTSSILHSGGRIVNKKSEADIIVADELWLGFKDLVQSVDHYPNKYVEGINWIRECIESGVYKNTPVMKKNFGGRIAGSRRTEFTAEDDRQLAGYIAARLPEPTMRGRTGNKLYQDLCSNSEIYPWAQRHPWQSWRERYKNNVTRFNQLVTAHLALHPTPEGGKGLHGYVRVPSSKPNTKSPGTSKDRIVRMPSSAPPNGDEDWGGSQWEIREGNRSPPLWGKDKGKRKEMAEHGDTQERNQGQDLHQEKRIRLDDSEDLSTIQADLIPPLVSEQDGNIDPTLQVNLLDHNRNELLQTQSSSYDIGEEAQKLLDANRNLVHLLDGELVHFNDNSDSSPSKTDRALTPGYVAPEVGGTHVSPLPRPDYELALAEIASEYRFSLDEVEEVYQAVNHDMNITRRHFSEIRVYITEKRKELGMGG